jgi:hypothetical protein
MTFQPAHKDTKNPPGQIRNEITLQDYMERKNYVSKSQQKRIDIQKKLTFEEYMKIGDRHMYFAYTIEDMQACWEAAQENK